MKKNSLSQSILLFILFIGMFWLGYTTKENKIEIQSKVKINPIISISNLDTIYIYQINK